VNAHAFALDVTTIFGLPSARRVLLLRPRCDSMRLLPLLSLVGTVSGLSNLLSTDSNGQRCLRTSATIVNLNFANATMAMSNLGGLGGYSPSATPSTTCSCKYCEPEPRSNHRHPSSPPQLLLRACASPMQHASFLCHDTRLGISWHVVGICTAPIPSNAVCGRVPSPYSGAYCQQLTWPPDTPPVVEFHGVGTFDGRTIMLRVSNTTGYDPNNVGWNRINGDFAVLNILGGTQTAFQFELLYEVAAAGFEPTVHGAQLMLHAAQPIPSWIATRPCKMARLRMSHVVGDLALIPMRDRMTSRPRFCQGLRSPTTTSTWVPGPRSTESAPSST
jgi:hypothetical protein